MEAENSTAVSSSKSGTGGATANSYIGSLISLTSKSEIRYEGILYNINTEESSIGLRNVRSFGTEGRKMDSPQVPPSDKVYEYILFRGTDIKDLQVKASPPVQTPSPINNDPAIIQSHYPCPPTPPTNFPAASSGSSPVLGSHYAQVGFPSSTFQSGLPLYQPEGNMNSWAPSPPNANGTGPPMPMYWPGFHGMPNGLPQLPQQFLLRPPSGLSVPPSMQQMQFSGFNPSLPMPPSSLPNSNVPDYQPSLLPNSTSSFTLTTTSTPPSMQQMHFSGFNPSLPMPSSSMPISNLPNYHSSLVPKSTSFSTLTSTSTPASSFPFNAPPLQPMPLPSETMYNLLQNKFPVSAITASARSSSFTSLAPLPISVPNNTGLSLVGSKPSAIPSSSALPSLSTSQPVSSVVATSGSVLTETPTPSLVTPGQLLQSGPSVVSVPQPLQATHKDVELVHVSARTSPQPSVPVVTEAQPPILPLPPNTRAHKPNGGTYHMRNNYRGRDGRGSEISRPVTKFTEEFDFTAMNEKFNKDEVWGYLGKSNKSPSEDKEGYGSDSDEEPYYEYDAELPTVEVKPVYNKDDFFDSLSCNTLDNNTNHGRPRYSEQMKLDTETFGDFSRYRGGRGGGGRGGGRFRASYYGRGGGYGGYGYGGRGRGHGTQNRTS